MLCCNVASSAWFVEMHRAESCCAVLCHMLCPHSCRSAWRWRPSTCWTWHAAVTAAAYRQQPSASRQQSATATGERPVHCWTTLQCVGLALSMTGPAHTHAVTSVRVLIPRCYSIWQNLEANRQPMTAGCTNDQCGDRPAVARSALHLHGCSASSLVKQSSTTHSAMLWHAMLVQVHQ